MASPKQDRLKEILAQALSLGGAERLAFLDQSCSGDVALRADIEAYISAAEKSGALMGVDDETSGPLLVERPGTTVGRYKLLEQIGEGGFGVVFMAEQEHPVRRRVALKIIKLGMDTRQVVARFEAERQALAMMDHPNIAAVFDAGATETGRPYFVMELVKGEPITKYCDEHHVEPRQRLELFMQVCQAVQHAHQKGIIHRDIKPNNVLIALYDGNPVPKVIDFGVAKASGPQLTQRTLFTSFGDLIGTLEYMSPEQAQLNQLDVDTRSDIYSLGVLLYELLTGSTPLERERVRNTALLEMLRIVREEEPQRPSTRLTTLAQLPSVAACRGLEPKKLSGLLHGELDWIVMKALEKDRSRRYESANGLAMDLQRYLADEAVQACPPSSSYRLRKFARRNKVALALSGLALLFLVLMGSAIGWSVRDRAARQARLSGQLEMILGEVARLEQAEQWSEALVSARRAEIAIATGEATPDLERRAQHALADLELVRRIEDIRAQSGTAWGTWNPRELSGDPTSKTLAERAERDYAAAFRDVAIDVDALSAGTAAERITARGGIAAAVLPALDDWVAVRSKVADAASTQRLIDVLRIADPDPWRQRVRDCLARKDWAALETLVTSPDLDRQPAATISFLCAALRQQAEADTTPPGEGRGELGHRGFMLEINVLRRAQVNSPADFWINRRLGTSLIWLKSPPLIVQEGIGYLRTAVALRPQSAQARMHLGNGYEILQDFDQAFACYGKALELEPNQSDGWTHRAFLSFHHQRWEQAIADFTRAIELAPEVHTNWFHRGHAYINLVQWDAAAADFSRAIERWPDDAENWYQRGRVYAQARRSNDALADLRQAIDKGFKSAERMNTDGLLEPLRANDEFKTLQALMNQGE